MADSRSSASQQVEFIDYHAVDWANVRRTRCQFYQRFEYVYPGPIYNLKQRLVIVPADRYRRSTTARSPGWRSNPLPVSMRQIADNFGNRVLELEVLEADRVVSFEARMIVENAAHDLQRPLISPAEAQHFLEPTPLTMPDELYPRDCSPVASPKRRTEHDLAQRINDWVYGAMRYKSGVTTREDQRRRSAGTWAGLVPGLRSPDAGGVPDGRLTRALCLRAFARRRRIARLGGSFSADARRTKRGCI